MRPRPTRRPTRLPLLLLLLLPKGACHAPGSTPGSTPQEPAAAPPAPTHRVLASGRVVPVFPATLYPDHAAAAGSGRRDSTRASGARSARAASLDRAAARELAAGPSAGALVGSSVGPSVGGARDPARPAPDGSPPSVRAKLEAARLPELHLTGSDLPRLVRALADLAGVSAYVHPDAVEAFVRDGAPLDVHVPRPTRVRAALDLLCELAGDDVVWTDRHGLVEVTTRARARPTPGVRTYAVADLVRGVPSYPGRELGIAPPWGWEDAPPELGPPVVEADALVDWIRATVWPGTWDEDGHSIELVGDLLVVRHSNLGE